MKRFLITMLSITSIVISTTSIADKPENSVYLDGSANKKALILTHGRGKHPTWKVVNPLRKGVHEKLGYHTLSLQLPNDDKQWKKYANDFPEAYKTIIYGIRFLKEEKGVTTIFLMGHSMGSRMASAFVSENPDQPISGLVIVGCRNNGGYPLSCEENLQNVDIPVLDVWGGNNDKDSDAASDREGFISEHYQQAVISGANHKLDGYDNDLVSSVTRWLQMQ